MRIAIKFFLAALLVSSSAQAQSISGGTCTISDTLWHGDGTPFVGMRVIVSRVEKSGKMITLGPKTYLSDADGVVSFSLPQGSTAWIYANISGYNTPPSGAQVTIPDSSGASCTYSLGSLQPASTTVSTNAGIVKLTEVDGSPAYTISGNDDTLEVSNGHLSNPSTKKYLITIPTGISDLSDVDTSGTSAGSVLVMRSTGTWVDSSLSFNNLSDIDLTSATTGDVVVRRSNGTWVDSTISFDGLSDVDLTSATTGDIVMRRSNGTWVDTSASASITSSNYTWTGTHVFNNFITAPNFLEYLGGSLKETGSSGASDSTVFYIPMKMFTLSDTASIDFSTSNNFTSLDSLILLGGSISTLGDSAAFSIQVKQTVLNGAYAGAFNSAAIDSTDLGAGNVQVRWVFTSFGNLTTSARSTIRCKIWRSACSDNTGSDVYIERVLIYGVGLR